MAAGNGQEVAKFWASLGVKTNKSDLLKVDKFLKEIETRFAKSKGGVGLKLSKFTVDQKALNLALRDSFMVASRQVSFEISRFTVNHAALNGALRGASLGAGGSSRGSSAGAMGAGAMLSRAFLPIAAVAAGGYGLSSLNKRNQAVVAAQLQSNATVSLAGGNAQQGADSFNWLRYQGNRIGFNYLDASQDYNTLLSNFIGSGMSVKQGQGVFKGFSEYARVMKLGPVQQKRVFKALSDISGKGQLQAQELKLQLGQALPGSESLFAEAYQRQLKETGKGPGNLTGGAAIQALLAAMKAGDVKSSVLTYAGDLASARSEKTLTAASGASVAEQARYQNSINDLAVIASKSGVEEGFARIFRTLNDGLSQAGPLVERLSEGFNEATKAFRVLALLPQSFSRMLDGKDSFISKLIGPDEVAKWQDNIKAIVDAWNLVKENLGNASWADYLKTTLKEINALISGIVTTINASKWLGEEVASRIHGPAPDDPVRLGDNIDRESSYIDRMQKLYDKASDNNDTDGMNKYQAAMEDSQDLVNKWRDQYAAATGGTRNGTTTVTVGDIIVQSNATDPASVAQAVDEQFRFNLSNALDEAGVNYTKAGR